MKYLSFIIVALLIFGCTQQNPEMKNASNPIPSSNAAGGSSQATGAGSPPDLSTWDFAAFMESGAPIKCEIETEAQGQTQKSVLYIKGANVRTEDPSSPSEPLVMIMKGADLYIPQSDSPYCNWLKISSKDDAAPDDSASSSEDTDWAVPPLNFSCHVDSFGDEKFDTPGKACDIWEMYSPN